MVSREVQEEDAQNLDWMLNQGPYPRRNSQGFDQLRDFGVLG